ncbi:TetR family transcriptional regulator [Paraconexibacter sp. AEG42_29]|uniref:TetR/AcrR family transcriptional regulator n=1 Tax=Paraconexibacter sp. AEG42_29 TaxID=2997339 RepID=UPI00339D8CD2
MPAPSRPSFAEATRELLRTRVLDGADDLLRERTWSAISMADIAKAGGVSRQTVYNEFGSREAFAQEYVLREADRFVTAVRDCVLEHSGDARTAVEAAFRLFLEAAAERPLIRAIAGGDGSDGLLALVTTDGGPVLGIATTRLALVMHEGWPQAPAPDTQLLAETVVRLAISHAALPTADPEQTAAAVARLLAPFVDRVLRPAS